MINVAILDDEAVYLDKEKEITEAYFREKQEDCRVDTFQSIEWFVSGLKETCYDLYILDVENLRLHQILFTKGIDNDLPMTRWY